MLAALRRHWPEYLIEAALLGLFMVSACLLTLLLEHPASPARAALDPPLLRRALMGLAMGLTAVALIYSPIGQRSGAHFNPAVTLTFLRLGRVAPVDAAFYIAAQFAGGLLGVLACGAFLGAALDDPSVGWVATRPGPDGPAVAFVAELLISGLMMGAVLACIARPRLERYAGLAAGMLLALYITFESPLSGTSLNPARSLGSALPGGIWQGWWIYLTAPTLGMLLAGEIARRRWVTHCAKLHHTDRQRCIFCDAEAHRP